MSDKEKTLLLIKTAVEGITCNNCKTAIEDALLSCGVTEKADLENQKALVQDGDIVIAQREITDAGYQVVGYKSIG